MILPVGDPETGDDGVITTQAKRCNACGYLHPIPQPPGPDICEHCRAALPAPLLNLFRMQNVSTVRRDRITSDEEDRQTKGYELISGIYFARRSGRRSFEQADIIGDQARYRLAYGDTAAIWRINLGWRRRRNQDRLGFVLDVQRGYWGNADDAEADDTEDPLSPRTKRVIPYVEDSRNALLLTPAEPLGVAAMASLQAGLKAALQIIFQLEENELAAEPLPSAAQRNSLLIYESAEGGAGVLRRLLQEPLLWKRAAEEALSRCHVDPTTGAETSTPPPCTAACYHCLLTYQNQADHRLLDRHAAIPLFDALRDVRLDAAAGTDLDAAVESTLEKEFLDLLRSGGFRLPDRAQEYFEGAAARPDFVYDSACVAVYIDGPHHDYPERAARDSAADAALRDLGYRVIRFGHRDDWAQIIDANPSVFGEGQR